jgi:NadR type nicotinamide-nucleotide adenylyltransferase
METIARPHVTRVVLTGSESVGKTTLAGELAAHYGVEAVPEFVRDYAAKKGSPLDFRDHGPIAFGQTAREDEYLARADSLLLLDTDLLSTVVYCHHYFGRCPAFIEQAAIARRPALYLLLDIDVPWVADDVRDRGDRRADVQQLFEQTLVRLDAPFVRISGDWPARFAQATDAIDALQLRTRME